MTMGRGTLGTEPAVGTPDVVVPAFVAEPVAVVVPAAGRLAPFAWAVAWLFASAMAMLTEEKVFGGLRKFRPSKDAWWSGETAQKAPFPGSFG